MRIGIYDPYLDTMSGGERYMLSAALALSQNHTISIFWYPERKEEITSLAKERLGLSIENLTFEPSIFSKNTTILARLQESKKYDALFLLSDGSIPFVSSKLYLHFQSPMEWVNHSLLTTIKKSRVNGFICNSKFTKKYIDRKFGVNSKVIYPPVSLKKSYNESKKEKMILHVGRFGIRGQGTSYKKQEFLAEVFSELHKKELKDWKMVFVMSVMEKEMKSAKEFQEKHKKEGTECIINPPNNKVWDEYEKATFYWHASGFGEDIDSHPDRAEHFGISTVEAMGVGAVPIVYLGGGQQEIVRNGENGHTFSTREELMEQTLSLIADGDKRKVMARNAVDSANKYSQGEFDHQIVETIV